MVVHSDQTGLRGSLKKPISTAREQSSFLEQEEEMKDSRSSDWDCSRVAAERVDTGSSVIKNGS